MDQSRDAKPKARRHLWWAVTIVAIIGLSGAVLAIGAVAFSSAGTSLTRKDFATDASARAFVDGHVPATLPANVAVRSLIYDRFTDWRLEAHLIFASAASLDAYFEQARAARHLNATYCGTTDDDDDAGAGDTVPYYLPNLSACGSFRRGPLPNEVHVECNTR